VNKRKQKELLRLIEKARKAAGRAETGYDAADVADLLSEAMDYANEIFESQFD
jgi:hypothetical protein